MEWREFFRSERRIKERVLQEAGGFLVAIYMFSFIGMLECPGIHIRKTGAPTGIESGIIFGFIGGRFRRSDNVPQDGDSATVAEAAHSRRQRTPNARLHHPPVFAISNPATEAEEDDPGWSTLETSGSQFTT